MKYYKVVIDENGYKRLTKPANDIIRQFLPKQVFGYALDYVLGDGTKLVATDGRKLVVLDVEGADFGKRSLHTLTADGYLLPVGEVGNFPKYEVIIPADKDVQKQELPSKSSCDYAFSSIIYGFSKAGFWVNEAMFKTIQSLCQKDINNVEVFVSTEKPSEKPGMIKCSLLNCDITVILMPLNIGS